MVQEGCCLSAIPFAFQAAEQKEKGKWATEGSPAHLSLSRLLENCTYDLLSHVFGQESLEMQTLAEFYN